MSLSPAVFLDRDGTLMEEVHYCGDPQRVRLLPGVLDGIGRLHAGGFALIVITNQSGIGRGLISLEQYRAVHARLLQLLGSDLVRASYFCPDAPGTPSTRRKPAPGMLLEAGAEHGLDLGRSWLIGDKSIDLQCALAGGTRPILVQTGYGLTEDASLAHFVAKDFLTATDFILKHSNAR